jgi:RimJ/RimL family protein N-acetyltransferase
LILDPLEESHAGLMFDGLGDPELYRYLDGGPPIDRESLLDRYRRLAQRRSPDGEEVWLNWIVFLAGVAAPIGFVQATISADEEADIAYLLLASARNKGYAAEAVTAMLEWIASSHGVRRFVATVAPGNIHSITLLHRLEFECDGSNADGDLRFARAAITNPGRPLRPLRP